MTEVKLGYYELETKEYHSQMFNEDYEIGNLTGNFAEVDGKNFCTPISLSLTRIARPLPVIYFQPKYMPPENFSSTLLIKRLKENWMMKSA